MRNVLDAQARPRPPLRERLQASRLALQAAYLATVATRRRDASPQLGSIIMDCRRHTERVKQVSMGADGNLFCSARNSTQGCGPLRETADSSSASLRRHRSSAPGAVERRTGRFCALMTKPAAHHPTPSCRSEACIAPRALFEDSCGTNRPNRRGRHVVLRAWARLFCKSAATQRFICRRKTTNEALRTPVEQ